MKDVLHLLLCPNRSQSVLQNNDISPDLNILAAWSKGYTGRGVVLSILDDGIEKDHPDLAANYVTTLPSG